MVTILYERPEVVVDVSKNSKEMFITLHPSRIGPVKLPGNMRAHSLQLGWDYSHVYEEQLGSLGLPSEDWRIWATRGFNGEGFPKNKDHAVFVLWGERYVPKDKAFDEAFYPIYEKYTRHLPAFAELAHLYFVNGNSLKIYAEKGDDLHALALKRMLENGIS